MCGGRGVQLVVGKSVALWVGEDGVGAIRLPPLLQSLPLFITRTTQATSVLRGVTSPYIPHNQSLQASVSCYLWTGLGREQGAVGEAEACKGTTLSKSLF